MENLQSSNMIPKQISGISRISKLPHVLPYPILLPFDTTPSIKDIFCYIIRHYGNNGLSVLIYRQPKQDQIVTIFGDWYGNNIDLVDNTNDLVSFALKFAQSDDLALFVKIMRLIKIEQVQFFFGIDEDDLVLVDMQMSINKFAGPGMITDIFKNIYRVQEVLKIEIIDERAIEYINKGAGSYEGDLIIKPSRFRSHHVVDKNIFQPMYVEIKR